MIPQSPISGLELTLYRLPGTLMRLNAFSRNRLVSIIIYLTLLTIVFMMGLTGMAIWILGRAERFHWAPHDTSLAVGVICSIILLLVLRYFARLVLIMEIMWELSFPPLRRLGRNR